ncbi:MAG TPA: class I SAM-dependent methyltransferase [Bryobacteraceae bacterium]|nr:class I SAM-dependent methyltransferase [Bryobacteraceae bacterium]
MGEIVRDFYDDLAGSYRLMFEDWDASVARQASILGPLLERACGAPGTVRILDCACGIGTQALGLAKLGFHVAGSDLSPVAIAEARAEASRRGLDLPLYAADMRRLDSFPEAGFDAVICMDNALPHLPGGEVLAEAAAQMRAKLRPGGTFMASIRDYDRLIRERPMVQGPALYSDAGMRRIVFQVWDWIGERRYRFHLYITRETPEGWRTLHGVSEYHPVLREELTSILESTGFVHVRWLMPAESGFYQPLVLCVAPG